MADTVKLTTPVQYEQVIDGLNEIRPLNLDDTVRRVVSLPVINSLSVDDPHIVQGKVLRCDNNGAVLGKNNRCYNNYEDKYLYTGSGYENNTIVFGQRVYYVNLRIKTLSVGGYVQWLDPLFYILVKLYESTGLYYLPLVGTKIHLRTAGYGTGATRVYVYGFY